VHAFTSALPRKLRFTDDAMAWLVRRGWPGNVRELRNSILRLSLLAEADTVDSATLESLVGEDTRSASHTDIERLAALVLALPDKFGNKLGAMERAVLSRAMASTGGNKAAAARLLGLKPKAIERRWQKFAEALDPDPDDGEKD
jgi:DNA-binding NtrC family response regulator